MKRLMETDEKGFEQMLGETIVLFCGVYIYTGTLAGVNNDHLELANPKLVYETGELMASSWKDAQPLPAPWRVMRQSIEAWGRGK